MQNLRRGPRERGFFVGRMLSVLSGLVVAAGLLTSPVAGAVEGGAFGNYAVDATTLGGAISPPKGATVMYGYLLNYSADRFNDSNGDSAIPGFKANLWVEGVMVRRAWDVDLPWGMKFISGFTQEFIHADIEAGGISDQSTGLFEVSVQPVVLSGSVGTLHYLYGMHFLMPAGDYEPESLANNTLNYYTLSHELSFTWTPTPNWMLDLNSNISFNTKNNDTKYASGDTVGLTWGVNYRPSAAPKWHFGLSGLYQEQIEDDEQNGQTVGDGFRLKKVIVGPQATYWFSQAVAVMLKVHREVDVENAPQGDLIWLQAVFPL
ncbi:MAG: transporter [Nevskiales bacterium]|nr:transporter [Nevskiales bacterium]